MRDTNLSREKVAALSDSTKMEISKAHESTEGQRIGMEREIGQGRLALKGKELEAQGKLGESLMRAQRASDFAKILAAKVANSGTAFSRSQLKAISDSLEEFAPAPGAKQLPPGSPATAPAGQKGLPAANDYGGELDDYILGYLGGKPDPQQLLSFAASKHPIITDQKEEDALLNELHNRGVDDNEFQKFIAAQKRFSSPSVFSLASYGDTHDADEWGLPFWTGGSADPEQNPDLKLRAKKGNWAKQRIKGH
jgi:hypothetical protein